MPDSVVRAAQPSDCAALINLMRKLAEFEGYLQQFKVTEKEIQSLCFEQQRFQALVAECEGVLSGMLIYYELPFTYDLTPWLFIKELYVAEDARGLGIGEALMMQLVDIARDKGSSKIKWEVLSGNKAAQAFYCHLGANQESNWQLFSLAIPT